MISVLRLLRVLEGSPLDEVAAAIGSRKSAVSTAERFPNRAAGPRLQRKLSAYHGQSWSVLSQQVDTEALIRAVISSAKAKADAD